MSFFSNPDIIRPGPIQGNPLAGLNHRVAVNVTRILDCCIKKETHQSFTPRGRSPSLPTPAHFISVQSFQNNAKITDLKVSRIQERPTFARVSCNVTIPLLVRYRCDQHIEHQFESQTTIHEDVVLFVPGDSIFQFEIVANASSNGIAGRVVNGEIETTLCSTIVTKVVTQADILIPTYGHLPPPEAVTFAQDACRGFFDLPLYPLGSSQRSPANQRQN